ncbi:MAG TPA: polyribonucleotide nucleotidyltransferase [Alphaproteobacteria bacterium]|nr:polyribonucleotide nucleotidyltransferase [Alphaproteobacteria bacterium]
MFEIHREEIMWGGRKLSFETGRIARQADGAVLVQYGESSVLATVVAARQPRAGIDFFPLTCDYVERTYAAGKIPGGFFKREGRPTEKETLTSRLIDRPIRPLFVDGFRNETQVICTVLSHDMENDPDIVALIAASAALTISGIPFMGPIGGCRVGYKNGQYVLNPLIDDIKEGQLDLVVAGTHDAVLMVESEAKELSEEVMLGAVMFGHREMQAVIHAIIDLAEKAAKAPWDLAEASHNETLGHKVRELGENMLRNAYTEVSKLLRQDKVASVKKVVMAGLEEIGLHLETGAGEQFKKLEKDVVRGNILDTKKRIDGRGLADVRPIVAEVGVLPRTHGAALFTRGETQALVITTLGTGEDEQWVDALHGSYKERFLLHYNFPPYSVGETGRFGFTGRREIGHGKLAWRAIRAVLPQYDSFPYTIRVVSEITESNGSSSMASVCGASLSLMDAGVPITRPVAGIAMGLIKEGDRFAVLSDILGDEDHLGDMDFKVAGTDNGVTSLQMDIKITGITEEIMQIALGQAKAGRLHILGEMAKAMTVSRGNLNANAPRITTITIPVEKIREVIGSGGKVIQGIVAESGAKVDINDEGIIKIASPDEASVQKALSLIQDIVAEAEPGGIYKGKVVKVLDFGAFVNFIGKKDGLVHVSEISEGRVENVAGMLKEGDSVWVKYLGTDDRGKTRLSMRYVNQETGEEIPGVEPRERPAGGGGGGGGRDRDRRPPRRDRD